MIVSWNWLTDYVRLDMPVEHLTERFALTGLNLEGFEDVGGDIAIDLEVTSNRPDCLAHIGIAREISVLYDRPLAIPAARPAASGPPIEKRAGVSIEAADLCSRFTARVITGVKVGESPWWLKKRLETLGIRPISNIVDVTNYVMFECGQPLHAYDLDQLAENRLIVRRAKSGEKLTAINNRVYDLHPEMLVIADAARPVGLAGVMGGLDSEIGPKTQNILIESARFDAMSVRRTSRALSLFSPSSFRFERPLDPEVTEWASRRCAELILKTAGGTLHSGSIVLGTSSVDRPPVTLRFSQIARVLGISIEPATAVRILKSLGLELSSNEESSATFRPPSWRADLEREIDLIEEVARIHGYEHIPEDRAVPLTSARRGPRERVESAVREFLIGEGFDEAVTFSLVEDKLAVPVGRGATVAPLKVEHSSRKRENALRQSVLPSLMAVRLHNESHGHFHTEMFEIAQVYLPRVDRSLPDEPTRLALVSFRDFRQLKGLVEVLLDRLHIPGRLVARAIELDLFEPGRAAELLLGDAVIGYIGEVARSQLEKFGLNESCGAVELDFDVLLSRANLVAQHRPLPPFPTVVRDLSLVVPRALSWGELEGTVEQAGGKTLEGVNYLDIFQGGNIPDDQQSVHFSMIFRHSERTLTGEEVERSVTAVVDACKSRFGAKLRS
jgi:phenylalanyl-tRNA synthetase beta chain